MMRPGPGALLHDIHKDFTVGQAPRIFPVGGFIGVVRQVEVAELVHLPILHAAEARKEGFRQVVGCTIVSAVLYAVIHAAGIELGVKRIVSVGFIRADR